METIRPDEGGSVDKSSWQRTQAQKHKSYEDLVGTA